MDRQTKGTNREELEDDEYNYLSRTEQHKEIVADILSNGKYTIAQLAPYLGCSTQEAARTKFSRGTFSVDDIIMLLCLSGLHLKVYKGNECIQEFEPSTYVRNDRELWSRYSRQKQNEIDAIRQQMMDTKMEVESVKARAIKDSEKKANKVQNISKSEKKKPK